MDPTESPEKSIKPHTAAFAVHVFTACGAACALLALIAAVGADWPKMFVWLGIALIIDGVDGTFARRLHTAELLPRWSGDVLDLVVDILTYVFVPAYAIATSGLLPQVLAVPLGALIVITGSLYFADRQMKTSDYYFRGFPALWNVAAFYLFLLKLSPWLWRVRGRGARGADLRADSRRASDPDIASARDHDRGVDGLGAARRHRRGRRPCARLLDRCGTMRFGHLLRRHRFPAPPSSWIGRKSRSSQ